MFRYQKLTARILLHTCSVWIYILACISFIDICIVNLATDTNTDITISNYVYHNIFLLGCPVVRTCQIAFIVWEVYVCVCTASCSLQISTYLNCKPRSFY